jgi:hypothetical protein
VTFQPYSLPSASQPAASPFYRGNIEATAGTFSPVLSPLSPFIQPQTASVSFYPLPSAATAYSGRYSQPAADNEEDNAIPSSPFKPSFPVYGSGNAQFSFYDAGTPAQENFGSYYGAAKAPGQLSSVQSAAPSPDRQTPYYGAAKAAHRSKFVPVPTGEIKNPLREAVEKRPQPQNARYSILCMTFHH